MLLLVSAFLFNSSSTMVVNRRYLITNFILDGNLGLLFLCNCSNRHNFCFLFVALVSIMLFLFSEAAALGCVASSLNCVDRFCLPCVMMVMTVGVVFVCLFVCDICRLMW